MIYALMTLMVGLMMKEMMRRLIALIIMIIGCYLEMRMLEMKIFLPHTGTKIKHPLLKRDS
jgi:hypothetical protein